MTILNQELYTLRLMTSTRTSWLMLDKNAGLFFNRTSLVAQTIKNLPAMQGTQVQTLVQEDALEKGMAIHSTILAWKIP